MLSRYYAKAYTNDEERHGYSGMIIDKKLKKLRHITPEGMRDLLLEECTVRRQAESRLTGLFRRYGFSEVMTPGLEFYDMFVGDQQVVAEQEMYKLTDSSGRLLAVRPDVTLPIARLVSARLSGAPLPLRLYYAQDVYRLGSGLSGHNHQQLQVGIELIGGAGEGADLEVLSLAAQSLRLCLGDRRKGFCLEIGHAGFFAALVDETGVDDDTKNNIRSLIETKNYAALGDLLDTLPPSRTVDAIRRLPRLFGGREVLDDASHYCHTAASRAALDYLRELFGKLSDIAPDCQVVIDLGLVHRHEYYTGVVFRGYIDGSGETVVSGGRYDSLLSRFGDDMPATGFGVNVDALTQVLMRKGQAVAPAAPDVLVHAMPGCEVELFRRMEALIADGMVCENSLCASTDEARKYATARGIRTVEIVSEVNPL